MRRLHSSLSPDLVKTFFALALVSVAFGCARRPSSPEPALNSISGDRMLADIRTLSSDEFQGRGPGSKGEELTIQYLQDQFRSAGLEPGNPDGTYLQAVRLVGITADPQMKLSFNGHGQSLAPKFENDFVAWTKRVVDTSAVDADMIFAGYGEERFSHFRKTFGYANSPLDGLWLRAPYLHNGSVPTLRDLLEPSDRRPKTFYRGYDVYDQRHVGFLSDLPEENGKKYFLYNTDEAGNSNAGHEGRAYGTELPAAEKDALVEYLKTF